MKYTCIFIIVSILYFIPICALTQTVTDVDGNKYTTVTIGTQIWFQQNLKTTKFNDGSLIPFVANNKEWAELQNPSYCYTNNMEYGALYNWFAASSEKICPKGWHVPSESEWSVLVATIGGELMGGELKEKDTIHWEAPNLDATNSTGFTALPAGYRAGDGAFYNQNTHAFFWSTTKCLNNTAWYRSLGYKDIIIGSTPHLQQNGMSIRCIKNN